MTTEKKIKILTASVCNSCMTEVFIPDFNKTIIKNIISLFLSFSNTEGREVVFCTQWFIGQYWSEREGRGYRCRCTCTSVPLSLYFISILWRLIMTAFHSRPVKVDGFFLFQTITSAKVWFSVFLFLLHSLAFPHFLNAQQVTKAAVFDVSVG